MIESTSEIVLQRDLHEDANTVYTVLISARDSGPYQKSSPNTCTVTINVFRNSFSPFFVNTPYDRSVERTRAAGFPVVKVSAEDRDIYVSYWFLKSNKFQYWKCKISLKLLYSCEIIP